MTAPVKPGCEPFSHEGGAFGALVLHGFTSCPGSLRGVAEAIAAAGYAVELPRLPGHGTSIDDLIASTWAEWAETAEVAFDALAARCERVGVVGLSLGGGLAAHVAEVRPAVAACVLINPIVKPPPDDLREGAQQLVEAGIDRIDGVGSDTKAQGGDVWAYDTTPLAPLFSLAEGIEGVYERLPLISAPILLLTSREDHVITWDNGTDLVARVAGPVERVWLENSYHVATLDNDRELVESMTVDFLGRVLAT